MLNEKMTRQFQDRRWGFRDTGCLPGEGRAVTGIRVPGRKFTKRDRSTRHQRFPLCTLSNGRSPRVSTAFRCATIASGTDSFAADLPRRTPEIDCRPRKTEGGTVSWDVPHLKQRLIPRAR